MFADIHMHALAGVDDGADNEKEMFAMIDMAYKKGTRVICVTPHCAPRYFGINVKQIDESYKVLKKYVKERYVDMELYLGNELRYSSGCLEFLASGICKTLNNTRYLLVDFSASDTRKTIVQGINTLLNAGYIPILAHVERYVELQHDLGCLYSFKDDGVLIQIDAQALFRKFGLRAQRICKKLLDRRVVDLVASDAHGIGEHHPGLSKAYQYVADKYGKAYANAIFRDNAIEILRSTE